MKGFGIGWRQVVACFALLTVGGMIAATYGVVAVPLGREFQPSRMVLMLAMTIMALGSGILSPWLGAQMDRRSLRTMMLAGALLLTAGFLALSLAASFTQVLVIYGLFMAPANVLIGPMAVSVLISRWFVRRRGAALGMAIAGVAMGGFLFPPIIQGLLDMFEWRVAFRYLALIIFLCTVPAAALVVNRPGDRGLYPDGADSEPEEMRGRGAGAVTLSARAVLSDPTFWCAVALFAVILSGMKGMVTNLVPMALDEGIDAGSAALLISIYAACGFVAKLSFAGFADRMNLRSIMVLSLGGFALGMACLTQADAGYWPIAAGAGLVGLFGGLMVPLQGLLVPRIYGPHVVGRVAGLLNLAVLVAMLATPPVFGLIFDLTGSYDVIFILFAALAALTMACVPYIRVSRREEDRPQSRDEGVLATDPGA